MIREFGLKKPRLTQVTSTDTVDNSILRARNTSVESVTSRQMVDRLDKIINDLPVGKDRELYEPVINPTANIIQSVGVGSTVYLQSVRPFFNPKNELNNVIYIPR